MALPNVTAARIDEALAQFDQDERRSTEWKGWEDRKSFKHAIVKNGSLYPPKEILSLATGLPVSKFDGGGIQEGISERWGHHRGMGASGAGEKHQRHP